MFAIWLTGPPASGKSTIAAALLRKLRERGLDPEVLESDVFRRLLAFQSYDDAGRVAFYALLAHVGALLVRRGVPVIFDATANRRAYRDAARAQIPNFVEVFVDCPGEVCAARDPKGLYRQARAGEIAALPGAQVPYEAPERPDIRVPADREDPETAAARIVEELASRGYIATPRHRRA